MLSLSLFSMSSTEEISLKQSDIETSSMNNANGIKKMLRVKVKIRLEFFIFRFLSDWMKRKTHTFTAEIVSDKTNELANHRTSKSSSRSSLFHLIKTTAKKFISGRSECSFHLCLVHCMSLRLDQ